MGLAIAIILAITHLSLQLSSIDFYLSWLTVTREMVSMRIYCVLSSFCLGTSMCKEALVISIKVSIKKASFSFPQSAEKRILIFFSIEPSSQDGKKEIISRWLGRLWDTDKIDCFLSGFLIWIYCKKCRRKCQPTPVFLPGESHGQRSLVGYSPWGCRVRPLLSK